MWSRIRGFATELFPTAADMKHAVKDVVVIIGVFHVGTNYGVNLTYCVGPSMLPTIPAKGNMVLIDTFSYKFGRRKFQVGDVVICTCPYEAAKSVCKRVAATEGDSVFVKSRSAVISSNSNAPLLQSRDTVSNVNDKYSDGASGSASSAGKSYIDTSNMLEVVIPPGHVWLAGDNNVNSTDSRTYGPVPLALLKGRAFTKMSLEYVGKPIGQPKELKDKVNNNRAFNNRAGGETSGVDGGSGGMDLGNGKGEKEGVGGGLGEGGEEKEIEKEVVSEEVKEAVSWSPFRDVPSMVVDHSLAPQGIVVRRRNKHSSQYSK